MKNLDNNFVRLKEDKINLKIKLKELKTESKNAMNQAYTNLGLDKKETKAAMEVPHYHARDEML